MLTNTTPQGDVLIHTHELADPNVKLDLTADRWNLSGDQASVMVGRDVITPDVFGPDGGRKPIGSALAQGDRPLVDAFGLEFFGRKVVRFSDVFNLNDYEQRTSTSLTKLSAPQAWPIQMVDGLVFVNQDERVRTSEGARRITALTTTNVQNDTLNWNVDLDLGRVSDKFHILYARSYDKRGVWVTNGRKFWLLQGGVFRQYLDLGAGLEGRRWDIARISRNLIMFVSDKYSARIIHLDEEPSTELSDNGTLAGMITPIKPQDVEIPEILSNNSWLMKALGSGGSITAGTCRIRVRAVNLDDGGPGSPAHSRFVQVYDEANPTVDSITVVDNDRVAIWNEPNNTSIAPPPLHERWTHIEVWRTTAGGIDYFREQIIELAALANERHADDLLTNAPIAFSGLQYGFPVLGDARIFSPTQGTPFNSYVHKPGDVVTITAPTTDSTQTGEAGDWKTGSYRVATKLNDNEIVLTTTIGNPNAFLGVQSGVAGTIYRQADIFDFNALVAEQFIVGTLADVDLTGFPVMTADDVVAGGPPPICRKVASVGGVTICMGKAVEDVVNPTADSRNFYADDFTSVPAVRQITNAQAPSGLFVNYTFQSGDRFVVTEDRGGSGITFGEHEIESRASASAIVLKRNPGGTSVIGAIQGHVRRAYELEWPTVKSDEDVWYSRADKFAPESFPVRTLAISSIGDTFRNMVNVGNYVAVLMDSGVHLLFVTGGRLFKDTIAAAGQGTPWEHSVVVVSNTVLWGSAEGPKTMTVTTEVASSGMRAQITPLAGTAIRQWFRDAFNAGEEIDGGVDEVNHCVRWRRQSLTGGTSQACQYSYRTGRWTLLDDDSGFRYAATGFAELPAKASPVLYSIGQSGAAFEVNYQGKTHPYDDVTVQAVLDESYDLRNSTVTPSQIFVIEKPSAFSPFMLGDVVRFRSSNSAVNGLARVIIAAGRGFIVFAVVEGLMTGDEFIIGATRFRYRPARLHGKFATTIKTLDGLTVRALPGPRNNGRGNWPDPPQGKFTLRLFREYDNQAIDVKDREIPIYDEDDESHVSEDRVSGVEGSGSAIELELEMIESRTDFRLELIEAEVREEGDQVADVSVTE